MWLTSYFCRAAPLWSVPGWRRGPALARAPLGAREERRPQTRASPGRGQRPRLVVREGCAERAPAQPGLPGRREGRPHLRGTVVRGACLRVRERGWVGCEHEECTHMLVCACVWACAVCCVRMCGVCECVCVLERGRAHAQPMSNGRWVWPSLWEARSSALCEGSHQQPLGPQPGPLWVALISEAAVKSPKPGGGQQRRVSLAPLPRPGAQAEVPAGPPPALEASRRRPCPPRPAPGGSRRPLAGDSISPSPPVFTWPPVSRVRVCVRRAPSASLVTARHGV